MSFLHDAGTASIHNLSKGNDLVAAGPLRGLRKSQSHGGLLSPLLSLARNPTAPIEGILGGWRREEQGTRSDEGEKEDRRQVLYLRMKEAETYEIWRSAACELDSFEGNNKWKKQTESPEYNVALIQGRLKQLDEARLECDVSRMLFLIRTSLTRGLGGMGDLRLYKHSHIGTKDLIERYIDSAQKTLQALLDLSNKNCRLEPRYILDQLLEARQAFGRSALLLSGGGTFGMNHIGVVKSLWEVKLLPRIVSGSSAGSIVCAVLCTKTDAEIPQTLDEFCYGDLAVFDKEGEEEGVLRKAARFLKYGSLFDISHLIRVMRDLFGDMTFQEAYNRTRRILNISVSSESIHELPRLLNYITAPNVMIWSAVAASCSVPLIFSPAQLLAKDPKTGEVVPWNPSPQRWIDGSVDNDLPMTRLAEMFNVNHFIVSQVNPHVVPFLSKEDELVAAAAEQTTAAVAAGPGWLHTLANLAKGEALHRMHVLAEMGVFPNYFTKARSVLSQKYSGDITILPEISYAHFPRVLKNPTTDFMVQAMMSGERATWPKLSRIQNHCAIELALDAAIRQLRSRIVFSPSQVDLRLTKINTHGKGPQSSATSRERARRSVRISHRPSQSIDPNEVSPPERPRSFFEVGHKPYSSKSSTRSGPPHDTFSPMLRVTAAELLSSSADEQLDANLFTDDNDDTTDSYSSESSPPSPLPALWPSTRQLFPSASQPSTPFFSSKHNQSSADSSNLPTPANFPPNASTIGLAMTAKLPQVPGINSSSGPSSPEIRYKRLFHGASDPRPPTPANAEAGASDDLLRKRGGSMQMNLDEVRKPDGGRRGSGQPPLVLDISGTRGMLLRRKRSMSTGNRGIQPPGGQ